MTVHQQLFIALTLLVTNARATLIWSDEFNAQESRPNPGVWSYDVGGGGWGNGQLEINTPSDSNSKVEGGLLKIIAREEEGQTFTSARIKTEGKMSFKYGTLEARIRVPNVVAGLWPAFWTMGSKFSQVGWPKAGEIDIMEIGQGLAIEEGVGNRRVVSAAHWDYQGQYATYAKSLDFATDLSQDFHIYRLEWTPNALTTSVDGQIVWTMNISPEECEDCEELHDFHFVILNMAVGGGFTSGYSSSSGSSSSSGCSGSSSSGSSGGCPTRGPDDITAPLPAEMLVDWVRLYHNGHTEISVPSTPQPTAMGSTAEAQTPNPTPPPTKRPTPSPTQIVTPEPTPRPTSTTPRQTATPTRKPTPRPSPEPTRAPVVVSLPIAPSPNPAPFARSRDSFEDDDSYDDDDCLYASGSRSYGGKGKGGKSGKSGSYQRSNGRSGGGGKAGKGGKSGSYARSGGGGKAGKGSRRRALKSGKGKGKGKGGSGGRSGASRRCGTRGNGRASQSSYLQAQEIPASSSSAKMTVATLFFCMGLTVLNHVAH